MRIKKKKKQKKNSQKNDFSLYYKCNIEYWVNVIYLPLCIAVN